MLVITSDLQIQDAYASLTGKQVIAIIRFKGDRDIPELEEHIRSKMVERYKYADEQRLFIESLTNRA